MHPDMLVNLYSKRLNGSVKDPEGFAIRRAMSLEAHVLHEFIIENFSEQWFSEVLPGMAKACPSVFLAFDKDGDIAGFAAYDCTAKGYFGPIGVKESCRRKGVGEALAKACLLAMKEEGYGYAIIGSAGVPDWYRKHFGAVDIGNSPEESVYSRDPKLVR
jgi:N-acetylglutamate synthase-like GNAT family acetyltransferase